MFWDYTDESRASKTETVEFATQRANEQQDCSVAGPQMMLRGPKSSTQSTLDVTQAAKGTTGGSLQILVAIGFNLKTQQAAICTRAVPLLKSVVTGNQKLGGPYVFRIWEITNRQLHSSTQSEARRKQARVQRTYHGCM